MAISICIIGSGFGMYGLLPAFSNIRNCNVVSICGKNSQRMEQYCKKFHVKRYDDWKEMIQKENAGLMYMTLERERAPLDAIA